MDSTLKTEGKLVYLTRCQFCHGVAKLRPVYPNFFNPKQPIADRYESSQLHFVQPEGQLAHKRKRMLNKKATRKEAQQLWE